jgi:hypothetical protein
MKATFMMSESGNSVAHFTEMQTIYIDELISSVRDNLTPFMRKKVQMPLVIKDHAQDAI